MKASTIIFRLFLVCLATETAVGENLFGAHFWLQNRMPGDVNAPIFNSDGIPLDGPRFRAELFGGLTPATLRPAVREGRGTRVIVPFQENGFFFGQVGAGNPAAIIPGVPGGSFAWVQVRAWDSRLGETYEDVVARGLGGYGESPIFYAKGGLPAADLGIPEYLFGLQSFRLRPATAVLLRGIRREGSEAVIEWLPGFARYQLQSSSELSGPWQNVGEPTTGTTLRISLDSQRRFFRVVGMIE
jgi:hypothetical protein